MKKNFHPKKDPFDTVTALHYLRRASTEEVEAYFEGRVNKEFRLKDNVPSTLIPAHLLHYSGVKDCHIATLISMGINLARPWIIANYTCDERDRDIDILLAWQHFGCKDTVHIRQESSRYFQLYGTADMYTIIQNSNNPHAQRRLKSIQLYRDEHVDEMNSISGVEEYLRVLSTIPTLSEWEDAWQHCCDTSTSLIRYLFSRYEPVETRGEACPKKTR